VICAPTEADLRPLRWQRPEIDGPGRYSRAMSDETARKLSEAETEEAKLRAEVDAQVRECLKDIAHGIPARVDKVAKKAAHSEPEVAKQLGADGLRSLRQELADTAAALAAELEAAAEQIEWPRGRVVKSGSVHSALFKFLYGRRVDTLAAVMKRHGFSIQDDNAQRAQGLILPQDLYDQNGFDALAEALTFLSAAERAVAEAKAADDRAVVDSLWSDE
jgi:hypothetical protein